MSTVSVQLPVVDQMKVLRSRARSPPSDIRQKRRVSCGAIVQLAYLARAIRHIRHLSSTDLASTHCLVVSSSTESTTAILSCTAL